MVKEVRKTDGLTRDILYSAMPHLKKANETDFFCQSENLPEMHKDNRKYRLQDLMALRAAFRPTINKHVTPDMRILEVGCGDGFLTEYLVPELKENTISVDINMPSLQEAQKRLGEEATLVQADVYHLPFADGTFDGSVSLSAFDSTFWLGDSVAETARCIKSRGPLVFAQDLVPNLYAPIDQEPTAQATAIYHQKLITTVQRNSQLVIVEGGNEDDVIEVANSEPIGQWQIRNNLSKDEVSPLAVLSNQGDIRTAIRPRVGQIPFLSSLMYRHECQYRLSATSQYFQTGTDLSQLPHEEHVVEWTRVRVLVAEKAKTDEDINRDLLLKAIIF